MKASWQDARNRFAALAQRERLAVTLAVVMVVGFGVWRGVVQPAALRTEAAHKASVQAQATVEKLVAERQQIEASLRLDPNQPPRDELQQLERSNVSLRQRLLQGNSAVATSQMLASALRAALVDSPGVRLVSLAAMPVETPTAPAATTPAAATPTPTPAATPVARANGLHRQKITVILQGNYPDLARYVQAVEAGAPTVAWDNLALQVEAWPRATLKLELSTLSLEKVWLGQ